MVNYNRNNTHYIAVTGILFKENKYLIVKRADFEKAFPNKWTVPGGKLEVLDYALRERDTKFHWYNVLENNLRKEVMEEVGIEIKNIGYITSMVYVRDDFIPCLVISFFAEPVDNNIILCKALTEYKWINLEEAKDYDLIEGIYEELKILDEFLKSGKVIEWKKNK